MSDILGAPEDGGLLIETKQVGMVEIVGTVQSVDNQATKTTYVIDDDTGSVKAVHWTDNDNVAPVGDAISERMTVRVVGSFKSLKGDKHVMVFRICPVEGPEEVDAHKLEVQHAKLKIRQVVDKENRSIGIGNSQAGGGLSNSMVSGFGQNAGATSMSSAFANQKHDAVFKLLSGCTREEGLSRDEMMDGLKGRLTRKDLDDALEYLSGEGHIYSTMDDDHFKTTDA